MQNEKKVVELNIADVLPNRFQPRIRFDENSINELALSIRKYGVIQPIVVRKIGDKYEIIAGERRYKASVIAGKQTIPAIISEMTDKDSVEIALIENVQREDLTPIEKAISYKKILDMGYISQEDLAQKVGKSQSSIANTLRLLNLSDDVQEALLESKISERHARSLLKLKDEKQQVEMLNRIINERLTVRKTDEEIDKMLNDNMNNNLNFENTAPEEVVQIPDIELSSIDTTKLPGFMDIDKIEQTAQDITPQEKPVANMDELLKSTAAELTPPTENPSSLEPQGKFFNFFEEEPKTQTNNQSDFNLENFFSSMNTNTSNDAPSTQIIEPTIPEAPAMPSIEPSIPSVEPTIPEAPVMPSMEPSIPSVEPTIPEAPAMPSMEPIIPSVESTIPEAPVMPSMEPSIPSVEPTVPEAPAIPSMEPSIPSVEPTIPEAPAMPSMEPSIPSVEPTVPEAPAMPSIEPSIPSVEPTVPEVSTMPSIEPSIPSMEPTVSEATNIESAAVTPEESSPLYEVPIAEDTTEIPTIDEAVNTPIAEQTPPTEENIAAQNVGTTITAAAPNIRLALNTIRECENTLEKYGFTVDVEEIDFEDSYQVIFKIEKK